MKPELVRVQVDNDFVGVWIGEVLVNRWTGGNVPTNKAAAEELAAAIQKELDREFEVRARWVAKESRYREVRHY